MGARWGIWQEAWLRDRRLQNERRVDAAEAEGIGETGAGPELAAVVQRMLSARSWAGAYELESSPINPSTLAGIDCVVIVTDHGVVDYESLAAAAPLVVDTRNAIKRAHPHVFRLGAPDGTRQSLQEVVQAAAPEDAALQTVSTGLSRMIAGLA